MVKIYDHLNMYFDDVFVIYTQDGNGQISSTEYIYFDEDDAQKEADTLNEENPILKHRVCPLTGFVWMLNQNKNERTKMKPGEFRAKYSKKQITDYLYGIDLDADHEVDPERAEFYRDFFEMMVELFPDCDWRK